MLCSFECTFCTDCVSEILKNVCPNCGGGFQKRPVRPKHHLKKYPPESTPLHAPVDLLKFQVLLEKNQNTPPTNR